MDPLVVFTYCLLIWTAEIQHSVMLWCTLSRHPCNANPDGLLQGHSKCASTWAGTQGSEPVMAP